MKEGQHVHFVGIGGIGMSGIARVLLEMNWRVSGSDLRSSGITEGLRALGATIFEGHRAENVAEADVIVLSSAIPASNPELVEARRRNLPVYGRSEMLGFLMRQRFGIAVAGTHGKTTTTSMVARVLEASSLRPTVIIGGEVNDIGGNAKLGLGEHLVAEADESDASFLDLDPRVAVITNIDSDVNLSAPPFASLNFDYDLTMNKIEEMFEHFMARVPADTGKLILCFDNERVRKVSQRVEREKISYALDHPADLTCKGIELKGFGSTCTVIYKGEKLGLLRLGVPGRHNISNALAAIACGLSIGLEPAAIFVALERFEGVQRRFQILGEFGGVTIVDDYAHNPQKIQAALHAARSANPHRVIGVFQPHRYTRTKFLAHEFAVSFEDADVVLVTDIYSAGEVPIVGARAENVVELIRQHGKPAKVVYTPHKADMIRYLVEECEPGDVVVTLGAGDIGAWGASLGDFLGKPPADRAAM
ncbi:MAG: UDP-N-acetylmuramate--L-alanine ligase [Vulcanimicrobiota bacterium]